MFSAGEEKCKSCHRPDHVFLFREVDKQITLASLLGEDLKSPEAERQTVRQIEGLQDIRTKSSSVSVDSLPSDVLQRVVKAQTEYFISLRRTVFTFKPGEITHLPEDDPPPPPPDQNTDTPFPD